MKNKKVGHKDQFWLLVGYDNATGEWVDNYEIFKGSKNKIDKYLKDFQRHYNKEFGEDTDFRCMKFRMIPKEDPINV